MDLADGIKESLKSVRGFARTFINILGAPRAYGSGGALFDGNRFNEALLFLGVSLVATMILRAPLFETQPATLTYLASDAIWKFAVVLLETAIITAVWRLLKGHGSAANYLVANCFYFGVLSVIGHTYVLILHGAGLVVEPQHAPLNAWEDILQHAERYLVSIIGLAIIVWGFLSWRAYGDFNRASLKRTIAALTLVIVASIPVLWVGGILRSQLLKHLTEGNKHIISPG